MPERPRQGHLFGEPPPRPRRGEVGPAGIDPEQRDVAARLPAGLRMGTSSWSFPGWRGLVWDREATARTLSRRGLAAYARHPLLRAVGVDRTFYAPVSADDLRAYADQVPADFRFVVKVPAAVTSPFLLGGGSGPREPNPTWLDPGLARDAALGPYVEGLGPRAGALVLQFPPLGREANDPPRFFDRLRPVLEELAPHAVVAVELRDRGLIGDRYRDLLRATGATHCVSVHPRLPAPARQFPLVDPARPLVVRWMLGGGLGYEQAKERYAPFDRLVDEDLETRAALADRAVESLIGGREVLVIANNKAEGSAPRTVFRLAAAIANRLG